MTDEEMERLIARQEAYEAAWREDEERQAKIEARLAEKKRAGMWDNEIEALEEFLRDPTF